MGIQLTTSSIRESKSWKASLISNDRNDDYLEHLTESLIKGLLDPDIYRRTPFTDSI